MSTVTKTGYDVDFVEWTAQTAELLREGRFAEVDLEHLAEEIEDLGKSHRYAVESQMRRLLLNLIKVRIQPECAGSSWLHSIGSARRALEDRLQDSPSLRRYLEENLARFYRQAVADAFFETKLAKRAAGLDIPADCPYTLDELLGPDPEALLA